MGHPRTLMNESGQAAVEHNRAVVAPESPTRMTRHVREVPTALVGAAYLVAYVFLDWISTVEQPFANYSWSPNSGASIAFALMFGRRMIPFMFVAALLDDLVDDLTIQQVPLPLPFELASAILIGSVYGAAVLFLLHPKQRFDPTLQSTYSLFLLTATTAVSTALVAAGYVGMVVAFGLLPATDFVAALMLVYAYWTAQHLQLVYVLFVPVVWMAVRAGIEGVSLGILATQLGLILGFHIFPQEISEMPKVQALMLVLAL